VARTKKKHKEGNQGEYDGLGVIIVSRYWPPPKLVRDVATRCFGEAKADLHVIDPPPTGNYSAWESVLNEVETLYYLHDGKVAVAIIPLGIETGFIIALREACEVLGLKTFLAIVTEANTVKGKKTRTRKRIFGPEHRKYVYLTISEDWILGIIPLDVTAEHGDVGNYV